jgi:hypothetical protein
MMPIVVWSPFFLMAQGYDVTQNLLLQDNQSSILLERNGEASSGNRGSGGKNVIFQMAPIPL